MHYSLKAKSKKHITFLGILLLLFSNCLARQVPIPTDRLTQNVFESKKLEVKKIPYLLYLPDSYYTGNRSNLPLVLFLHGRGERGNQLEQLKRQALPKMIAEGKTDFPFILLAPQLPESFEEWYTKDLIALIEEIESDYSIDPERIYLTGISLGGNGTWKLAIEYPNKFAAVIPISGWGDASRICRLSDSNVWAFHGVKDTLIIPEKTTEMVERLQFCNPNVKMTLYPTAKHDAWTETYKNPEVLDWMLKQRQTKKKNSDRDGKKPTQSRINPLKVVVIGDSVGISISWGLNEFVQKNYHLTLENFAKVSSGLSVPKFFDWNEKLDEILSRSKYDLGIVLIGANDPQTITTDKGNISFKTDLWKVEYKERIKAIVERFKNAKMNLYWIELPPMGPKKYHAETRYLNDCFKEVADEMNFKYIPTTFVLGDEKGVYQKYLPYKGKKTMMRADDDIHLTIVAAKLIAREILTQIFSDYHFPE